MNENLSTSLVKISTSQYRMPNWKDLSHPDPHLAWKMFGPKICELIFCSSMVAVPSIEDAFSFDLLVCFSRNNSNLFRKSFRLLGHLLNIVNSRITNMTEILRMSSQSLTEDMGGAALSNTWKNMNKSVTIRMEGLSKHWINWQNAGTLLAVDSDKVDLRGKNLYMISQVIWAQMVYIEVEVNSSRITFEYEDFPVAYSYQKFTVDDDGILLSAKDKKLKLDAVFEGF